MSDDIVAVRRYISEGWQVLPIPHGEKGPRISNWQSTVFDDTHFQSNDNIGIRLGKPSNWLVDVDLDTPEALEIAPHLLLATSRIHGRPSKPSSHYWYFAENLGPHQFKDLDGSVILEIRSTGGQTVVPPSVHPSGELLHWEIDREPNNVDPEGLRRSVILVAVASILARHWPAANGSRHAIGGLAAGLLCALKLEPMEIEQVIYRAARAARDEEAEDRARFAKDTAKKFASGAPVAGGPKLSDIIGSEVVKRIRSWFGTHSDSVIDEMNEKHAVIFQQSGDLVVITEDRDCDGRPFIRFSDPETIRQLYPRLVQVGRTARNTAVMKPLGQVWFSSDKRRFYNGIELAPNGRATAGYYNMWRGFAVEPQRGVWDKFKRHIREVICCGNEEIFEYVISWMAKAVQKPGEQANTAIALRGGQGTGKGAFVRGFGALFGVHFIHLDSTRHLTGNFNAHLHNAILVFADEAAWPGDKAGLGALKRLITEPTLSIERKGHDIFSVPNVVHLLLASNEEWSVPAAMDERRFVVLDVDKGHQNNTAYFAALEDELHNGGLAAMLRDLLDYQISIDLRIIPKTEALLEQKMITANAQRRWWHQVLYDGDLWTSEVPGKPGNFRINRKDLHDNYVMVLDRVGQRIKQTETELGKFLQKILPTNYPGEYRYRMANGAWSPREYVLPSLEICRARFDADYGSIGLSHWPTPDSVIEGEPEPRGLDM